MISHLKIMSLGLCAAGMLAAQSTPVATALLNGGYINGVVQGEKGPEAGVWVIAETKDLPTNFIKIVVTDDRGRFVLPDLPTANYKVWVRGYGLLDSAPLQLKPANAQVTLKVSSAKTPQEAAKVYPGNYWLSLLEPPPASLFPGTGAKGNGVGPTMLTQNHWINSLKSELQFLSPAGQPSHAHAGRRLPGQA